MRDGEECRKIRDRTDSFIPSTEVSRERWVGDGITLRPIRSFIGRTGRGGLQVPNLQRKLTLDMSCILLHMLELNSSLHSGKFIIQLQSTVMTLFLLLVPMDPIHIYDGGLCVHRRRRKVHRVTWRN